MSSFAWKPFLQQWSQAILAADDIEHFDLPDAVIESGWLGFPGATEEQIVVAEARLGKTLPPSYREFLKVTNGWRVTGGFVGKLWSVDGIDWFRVRHQDWIDAWNAGESYGGPVVPVADDEYFVYGDEQDTVHLRPEYLKTALEISEAGDGAIMLLNPQIVTPEGEWEAWLFANWYPGAARYRSFWELLQGQAGFK